jgi:hypothetical protein
MLFRTGATTETGYGTKYIMMKSDGNVAINTLDFSGTPPVGKLIVKGTTNDGTTNIFVGRDSGEANVATLDTDGNLTLSGSVSAAATSFSGTTADTFTVNSDGTATTSTLALGAAGTTGGSITTGAGNLTLDSAGGTIDINDTTLDLATQKVAVTLNAAADALNFDSNTLSIDASANRVGVGTNAPATSLEVKSNSSPQLRVSYSDAPGANAGINLNPSTNNSGYIRFSEMGTTAGEIGYSNFFDRYYFGTDVTPLAVLQDDGNFGIGIAAPTSILHTVASGAKTADYVGNLLTNTATSSTDSIIKTGLQVWSNGGWTGAGAQNIGIYSNVSGGTNNIAGYFTGGNVIVTDGTHTITQATGDGDLFVDNDLEVGGTIYGSVSGGSAITGTTASSFNINSDTTASSFRRLTAARTPARSLSRMSPAQARC